MTTAEYVALARRAANDYFAHAWNHDIGARYLTVWPNGQIFPRLRKPTGSPATRALLRCDLTPETTASEPALVCALLASVITFTNYDVRGWHAALMGAPHITAGWGATREDAQRDLLDALLSDEVRA